MSGILRLAVESGGDASPGKVNAIIFYRENLDCGVQKQLRWQPARDFSWEMQLEAEIQGYQLVTYY